MCVRCRSFSLFHEVSSVNESWDFSYDILTSKEVLVSNAVYCVMESAWKEEVLSVYTYLTTHWKVKENDECLKHKFAPAETLDVYLRNVSDALAISRHVVVV